MTPCRFCAEPLPPSPSADARCPSCGERVDGAAGVAPRGLPPARVLTMVLGALYLALGSCCGLTMIVTVLDAASMGGASGGMTEVVVILSLVAALCLLHVAAGLGLILGQEPGRKAAIACAVVDILIGGLTIAAGAWLGLTVRDDPSGFVDPALGRGVDPARHPFALRDLCGPPCPLCELPCLFSTRPAPPARA